MKPSIQFAKRKDGVKIAYSQFGKGQPLVFSPAWVTSLRHILENPFMNQFIAQLAKRVMVVFYDKHGCGQSEFVKNQVRLASNFPEPVYQSKSSGR